MKKRMSASLLSANNTTTVSPILLPTALDFVTYAFYTTEGATIVVCNVVILLAIARSDKLKMNKSFLIVAGLAAADALDGFCYCWGKHSNAA